MKKIALRCVAILALAALSCVAADKPNFTGKWTLDTEKSDFGQMPPPTSQIQEIDHKDPKLKIKTTTKSAQGDRTAEASYTTDGEENTNPGAQGSEVKSRTKWDGNKLVSNRKLSFQGNEVEIADTQELGADGKTFTIDRTFKSAMGEGTQKLVFKKQE
jgi:hypothetical protein